MKLVDLRYCKNCKLNTPFSFSDPTLMIQETIWVDDVAYIYYVCPRCGYYECDEEIRLYVESHEMALRNSANEY